MKIKHNNETWDAETKLVHKNECMEIKINSRSGFTVVFGEYSSGYFAFFPVHNTGCKLGNLDKFNYGYNFDKIIEAIGNEVDTVTVLQCLMEYEK